MIHVTIATFISGSEQFHPALIETLDFLRRSGIEAEAIVFCDAPLKCGQPRIRQIVDGGKTKYSRILQLFSLASCEKIFCVDNDITIDNAKFKDFVLACASGNFVAAWGKIAALPCAGLVPNLIRIDKIVSHNFLRPLLWKLQLGISLPGQVFMFSRSLLKLPDEDTVFDDLQIGIAIKKSAAPFLYTDAVLGFEQPKLTLPKLVSQRIRWARGYVEVLLLNRKSPALTAMLANFVLGNSLRLLQISERCGGLVFRASCRNDHFPKSSCRLQIRGTVSADVSVLARRVETLRRRQFGQGSF